MKFEDILTTHGKKNKYAVRTRLIKLGNGLYDKNNWSFNHLYDSETGIM